MFGTSDVSRHSSTAVFFGLRAPVELEETNQTLPLAARFFPHPHGRALRRRYKFVGQVYEVIVLIFLSPKVKPLGITLGLHFISS
jgi:hypothetical protein